MTLLLQHRGTLQVRDFTELEQKVGELLQNPAQAQTLAQNGLEALQVHQGATQRTVEAILGQR